MKKVKILAVEGYFNCVAKKFEEELNKALREGWEMSGDMLATTVNGHTEPLLVYSQKLIKEVK